MAIAGTFPEAGVRVALDLRAVEDAVVRYHGEAFTPVARYELTLQIDVATGKGRVEVEGASLRDPSVGDPGATSTDRATPDLEAADLAFVAALGTQLWRQAKAPAEQGGGHWSRRIQRWRGPK